MFSVAAFACALLVGATLGLFGGGGAVLTVPILLYVVGVEEKSAVPMSLLVIGTASAIGALDRWRTKHLDPRRAIWFGLAAVIGAFAGAKVGVAIPDRVQLALFGAAVMLAAMSMLRSTPAVTQAADVRAGVAAMVFALIGAFTGIVGVGGGFLFVPALVAFVGVPILEATSLSLMVIAMNALSGFAGYWGSVTIDWRLALLFTGTVVAAMLPAGILARRAPVATLKRGFAFMLLAVGGIILLNNL